MWAVFEPRSVDVTVLLERPKLAPRVGEMRAKLARAVGIPEDRVSVKAKTMNGVGPVGEGKAYAAQATVVIGAGGAKMPSRGDSGRSWTDSER